MLKSFKIMRKSLFNYSFYSLQETYIEGAGEIDDGAEIERPASQRR
jgi:hypothetical protein